MLSTTITAQDSIADLSMKKGDWDEIPMLGFVNNDGEIGLMVMPGPGEVWQKLDMIATYMRAGNFPAEQLGVTEGKTITGVVILSEGYKITSGPIGDRDPASVSDDLFNEADALKQMGLKFSDHPESVEVKMIHACDAEGHRMLTWDRGDTEPTEVPEVGGRIPEYLSTVYAVASAL